MNRAFVFLFTILPFLASISSATESMVQQANAWSSGKPVPVELLAYRRSGSGASYTPGADDTSSVIGAITNAPLLMEMLFNPKIDERVFAQVVSRALHLYGPKTFLNDVYHRYQQHAEALLFPMHKRLFIELNQRHALVDAIFINEADMPATNAMQTMQRMIGDMQTGKSWDAVYNEYSSNLRSQLDVGLASGPVSVSKVSRFGPVVLCDQTKPTQTYVSDPLPREHREALLQRAEGEVILVHDPARRRVVLYRVRELYVPKPE